MEREEMEIRFHSGQRVEWHSKRERFIELVQLRARHGEGPFRVLEVRKVPRNWLSAAGHSQYLVVDTKQGRVEISGWLFALRRPRKK